MNMLRISELRTLTAARTVSTEDLCQDLQTAVAAAARAITATAEATTSVSAEFEAADGVSEERHAAFRTFAALAIATFDRFADEVARHNARLTQAH
ncbi:hypothetical protein R1A27_31560 (plasmid) [Methylobacterium sp. NMS12]|uniref:hypothetical protein n=1 Tax=Methylobacterium sp. NMS12 TaxID=3079766 RepID=UPI003F88472F